MSLQCGLCPKTCIIEPGQSGECRIRVNLDDKLIAATYGFPCSVHVDPVEKKPLFHFLPGTPILSLATVGCNLHCKNCQNWEISQADPVDASASELPPDRLVAAARRYGCRSIAYTYTDPIVYYEYTLAGCRRARAAGLRNALVTAGYINDAPLRELCECIDAANIDLKAMDDAFYRDVCGGTLKPVLHTLATTKSLGVMVEVTNLLISGLNDSDAQIRKLCAWVKANMGSETPLHFSRFFPHYRMRHVPPTPAATLRRARDIAAAEGLEHVYVGNILMEAGSDTRCPSCGRTLIRRTGYRILANDLDGGRCPDCGKEVYGTWQ